MGEFSLARSEVLSILISILCKVSKLKQRLTNFMYFFVDDDHKTLDKAVDYPDFLDNGFFAALKASSVL